MPKRILYWFRNDLRLQDNEALYKAIEVSKEIIPVYVFDSRKFEINAHGFRRTSIERAQFITQAIANLKNEICELGGNLIIRIGDPEKIVAELADHYSVDEVHASKEITLNETNIESSLSKKLKVINVDFELTWMHTLLHPHDLTFYINRLPQQFNLFRLAVQPSWHIRSPFMFDDTIHVPAEIGNYAVPSLADLGFEQSEIDQKAALDIEIPKESELINQIKDADFDATKMLFWIGTGLLSPRLAYLHSHIEVKANLIKELLWRDYLSFTTLKYGSRIFKPSGIRHDINRVWGNDVELFNKWRTGTTGNELVDQTMTKLLNTGSITSSESYVAANYLIDILDINWTWGAEWFESKLINFEVATDWGNWNYFANVGVGETPYKN